MRGRIVIAGAGVIGFMHAIEAVRAGHEVIHLEAAAGTRGASVRNFGLVWVSGRARGAELDCALRARELWRRLAAEVPGVRLRASGSLTLVSEDNELAVLEEVCARSDAADRGFALLDPTEVRALNPAVRGRILAGLHCRRDAVVEPRLVPGALRAFLEKSGRYTAVYGREVVDVAEGVRLTDSSGVVWEGSHAVLCPGAAYDRWLSDIRPLRRVRLQMMQTAPLGEPLTTAIADADSLRYYPAYDGPALRRLPPADPARAAWSMQLLMVQRIDGGLTIGDTHRYDEPFGFDVEEQPYALLASRAETLLGRPLPPVERRWAGIYSQIVPGVDELYLDRDVVPDVRLITGAGGRGMTMAPVFAERTIRSFQ